MTSPTETGFGEALDARLVAIDAHLDGVPAPEPGEAEAGLTPARADVERLSALLAELRGAIEPFLVAGLSAYDPELPDDLDYLASRALSAGWRTAARLLARIAAMARAERVDSEMGAAERRRLQRALFDDLQRLQAWIRLFTVEIDHLAARAELERGHAPPRPAAPRYEVATVYVRLVGVHIDAGGHARFVARTIPDGRPVILVDQLAEFDPDAPGARPCVSRLLQAEVQLTRVLDSVLYLNAHPVSETPIGLCFRPGFRNVPELLPAHPKGLEAPPIPPLELDDAGHSDRRPCTLGRFERARVSLRAGQIHVETERGQPIAVVLEPTLRLNLTRAILRHGGPVHMDLVLEVRDDGFILMSATTLMDGRIFPTLDPSLFRLTPEALVARTSRLGPRVSASRLLVACAARMARIETGSRDDPPASTALHDLWTDVVSGAPPSRDAIEATVAPILAHAATAGPVADPALLASLDGLRHPIDVNRLTSAALVVTIELCCAAGATALLERWSGAILDARYTEISVEPECDDVIARALLVAASDAFGAGGCGEALGFLYAHAAPWLEQAPSPLSVAGERRLRWAARLIEGNLVAAPEPQPEKPDAHQEPLPVFDSASLQRCVVALTDALAASAPGTRALERAGFAALLLIETGRADAVIA